MSLPESTKQSIALRLKVAEDVDIPVNLINQVMRGTLYQFTEESNSCPNSTPLTESSPSIESLRNRYTIFFMYIFIYDLLN